MIPKISKPNSKTGIESFNINNTVCKNIEGCKAQQCLKHCYYNKIKRIYPQQTPFLRDNLKASKSRYFVPLMLKLISKLKIRFFRIHSCGEFYSQEYFNKWCYIAQSFPNIVFYTYTKNIDLDVSRPKNFILKLSDDKGIWKHLYHKFNGVAKMKEKYQDTEDTYTLCPNQTEAKLKCIECRLCTLKGNIAFNRH